eukprot:NODE_4652_length_1135_cov_40.909091_g4129_i0.p1 GENE.NODE_4652_length_1135_cov_40.909091_g4129_i0~~NODE_4652_length_1135_cov_40.909091_g4129_i0.p1  ORF type:complete len:359 (+),score=30.63 NODE_4652_length_1135_cov_40.909091_g4129_i0:31-1077(+)
MFPFCVYCRNFETLEKISQSKLAQVIIKETWSLSNMNICPHLIPFFSCDNKPCYPILFLQIYHDEVGQKSVYNCYYCRGLRVDGPIPKNSQHLDINSISNSMGSGTMIQKMTAEGAAIILLGSVITAPCLQKVSPLWMGTGSWKMERKKRALPCNKMYKFRFHKIPNTSSIYWGDHGRDKSSLHEYLLSRDPRDHSYLTDFFRDIFDTEAPIFGCIMTKIKKKFRYLGLPWSNYFILPPKSFQTIARLHIIMVSWFDSKFPIGNSSDDNIYCKDWPEHQRCWSYFLEMVTLIYLCHHRPLLLIRNSEGCIDPIFVPLKNNNVEMNNKFNSENINEIYLQLVKLVIGNP